MTGLLLKKGAKTNILPDGEDEIFIGPWDESTALDLAKTLGIVDTFARKKNAVLPLPRILALTSIFQLS